MGKLKTIVKNFFRLRHRDSPDATQTRQLSSSSSTWSFPSPQHLSEPISPRPSFGDDEYFKQVYITLFTSSYVLDWAMIDPRGECAFRLVPEIKMNFPLGLNTLKDYGYAACDSKLYFIGGEVTVSNSTKIPSNKMFVYDPTTQIWVECSSCLNVGRVSPLVIVIGKHIYVCGGRSKGFTAQNWMEVYDLENDPTWKIVKTVVPEPLFYNTTDISCSAVYELGKKMFFFVPAIGIFSFDYICMSWTFECEGLLESPTLNFGNVAIVENTLFLCEEMVMYGYDLRNKLRLVFRCYLEDTTSICRTCNEYLYLLCVGENTLLLLGWDEACKTNERARAIFCCRYRIVASTAYKCGFRILPDGFKRFATEGYGIIDTLVV